MKDLKSLREAQGLTIQDLSVRSGVPRASISRAEAGQIKLENMIARNILALAEVLHVDPCELIGTKTP